MLNTRRHFIRNSASVTAGIGASFLIRSSASAAVFAKSGELLYESTEDPSLKKLIQSGIDAAKKAGASYADIRITHRRYRLDGSPPIVFGEREAITIGVRSLVNGYWGFASGPVWSRGEVIRLAIESVHLARAGAHGKFKDTVLAPLPVVPDGTWTTPISIDPYSLHPAQIRDVFDGLANYATSKPLVQRFGWSFAATVTDKSFGSSEDGFFSQRTFTSGVSASFQMADGRGGIGGGSVLSDTAGIGFEIVDEQKARDEIDRIHAEGVSTMPRKPVEVGRYDVVFSAGVLAQIIGTTIGSASELDRAIGLEANAGGTSYLNEPEEMTGAYPLGGGLLTVTGNRNEPGGLATVKWDDEGVSPAPFTIVDKGIVQSFQMNRELAAAYSSLDGTVGTDTRSNGCLYAEEGLNIPLIRTPNLEMRPGDSEDDLDSLIANIEDGVVFNQMSLGMDFQQLNGMGFSGTGCFQIKKGKITAMLPSAGVLFRAPELWKSLSHIGGVGSLQRTPFQSTKGEPSQEASSSITCPPVICRNQAIIDYRRKA